MRNPFARLAKRDTARLSLRQHAAALKASAARVIRRKSEGVSAAPVAADPILAAIAETRRLAIARTHALNVELPAGTRDPTPEQSAATNAFFAHVDGVLLQTVPTTPAGCAALARYAVEFQADEEFSLDEDASNNQHVRVLGLIARSPLLNGEPLLRPTVPDFSGYLVNDLMRTYNAFKLATDILGLSTWATSPEGKGDDLLDAECDRLSLFQGFIVGELKRRDASRWTDAADCFDTRISYAVACGDYEEVARLGAKASARSF